MIFVLFVIGVISSVLMVVVLSMLLCLFLLLLYWVKCFSVFMLKFCVRLNWYCFLGRLNLVVVDFCVLMLCGIVSVVCCVGWFVYCILSCFIVVVMLVLIGLLGLL